LKSFARNFRYWLPALAWLGVIAFESFRLSSAVTGSWLLGMLHFFNVQISAENFTHLHHFLRKAGHVTGYGLLSVLLFRSWFHTLVDSTDASTAGGSRRALKDKLDAHRNSRRIDPRWRSAALALSLTVLTAILDEWHQSFDLSRTGTFWDVVIDLAGGICFLGIALFGFKLWQRRPVEELEEVSA